MKNKSPADDPKVRFLSSDREGFYSTVRKRVEDHFAATGSSRTANSAMLFKSLVLTAIYLICYLLLISDQFGFAAVVFLYAAVGAMTGLIGFNITHDALHGSYLKSKTGNRLLGYSFDFNGTSSTVWIISHNLHHHVYTNIAGIDEDIDKMVWLRFSPSDGHYWFHRYQHLYALPLYTFTAINWLFYSDYAWFYREYRQGNVGTKDLLLFLVFKLINLSVFLFIPLLVLSLPTWQILLGYLAMQMTGGFIIAVVFQLAHIVEGVEYPTPDTQGKISECWAEHELKTTSNFAASNHLLGWILGGLNFQIEHHLFPHVCHIHYPAIAPIVKQTAAEFGIPYHEQPSFFAALCSHLRLLKRLGSGVTQL